MNIQQSTSYLGGDLAASEAFASKAAKAVPIGTIRLLEFITFPPREMLTQ